MTRSGRQAGPASRKALLWRLARPWSRALAGLDPRVFYVGLAIVLGAWMVATTLMHRENRRETSSYDWMLTHRFRMPTPDPAIVLVDIDERSLAAMSRDYGQWPWPRDVLATVMTELQAQRAQAIVFDILLSDADRRNPVSEAAFEDAVAKDRVSYFPVLRLDPASDATSVVRASQLPGLTVRGPARAAMPVDPTIAVSLPYFDRIVKNGRLGTDNIDPDPDSVIRRYRIFEDVGDYRVLSLPARLALDLGWPMPDASQKTLRFNRAILAYRTVSFSDLFVDLLRRERVRPADEFAGKIVVIGATAQGLFDLKGTPISRIHPGMDLLATAIDDTKNDRFIDELGAPADIAISLALLGLMAWLCIRYSHEQLKLAFVVAPGLLFGVSYLTLNLSKTFVDLSAPASIAFVYFSLVKIYSAQVRFRWSEGELFAPLLEPRVAHWVGCLATALHPTRRAIGFETRYLNLLRTIAPHVRITSGLDSQSWLGSAFAGVIVATWVEHADDERAIDRDRDEAKRLFAALRALAATHATTTPHFRETTIPADLSATTDRATQPHTVQTVVPKRLNLLRSLVSRTVSEMTEDQGR